MSKIFTTWVPEAAGELAVPAERVLAGDPALLVGGGAERQVGGAEQAVMGDDAVPGGEDVRQVGAHLLVDDDRALEPELRPGAGGQRGIRPHPDDDEDHVGEALYVTV